MIEKFKTHVSLDKFFLDCTNFHINKQTYDISYPYFIKYFYEKKIITMQDLVIGINFTYGWMPTIFDFRTTNFNEAIEILNDAKRGIIPTIIQFELLKGLFNNSLVGTTKLLHFINPEKFAIWDSRVYRYLTGKEAYSHRIGICKDYLSYLSFLEYLTHRPEYENFHISICKNFDYPMTKYRTAEMIMYLNGTK